MAQRTPPVGLAGPPPRERIIEAARELFRDQGLEKTRVEDILQRAGVSRPTFYRLFANKLEVYGELSDGQAPLPRTALERVREGAREAFAQRGYHGVRVDDLIAASGVARSTFYRIFHSKEDAFEQLDRSAVEYLRRAIRVASAGQDPQGERMRFTAEAYLEWRLSAGHSRVTLDEPVPPPRAPLAVWRTTPELGDSERFAGEDIPEGSVEPDFMDAAVVGVEVLANRPLADGTTEELHRRRDRIIAFVERVIKPSS